MCLSAGGLSPTRLPGTPDSKVPPNSRPQTKPPDQPANGSRPRITDTPLARPLQPAERQRIFECLQVDGEGDERLGGRQRIAVGVVGAVHRQAEGEPSRIGRRDPAGGAPRSRRSSWSSAAVSTTDWAAPVRIRERRVEEATLDRGHVGDQCAAASASRSSIEPFGERRRVGEVRLSQAVDSNGVGVGRRLRPDQLVGASRGGPFRRRPSPSRRR